MNKITHYLNDYKECPMEEKDSLLMTFDLRKMVELR